MSLSRLGFFALSGAGAFATGSAEVALAPSEYDRAAMLAFFDQDAAHKQVFQTERLDISAPR